MNEGKSHAGSQSFRCTNSRLIVAYCRAAGTRSRVCFGWWTRVSQRRRSISHQL